MAGYIGSKSSVTQVDGYTRDETDALVPTSIDDNGNATAITIDSSENVGIGTSSPSGKLQVQTSGTVANLYVRSDISTSALASRISLGNSTSASRFTLGLLGGGGEIAYLGPEGSFPLYFQTNGAERMRLDSVGNVLVGTTTQNGYGATFREGSKYLYLNRDGGTALFVDRGTSDGALAEFRKDGASVGSIGTTGGDFYITSAGGSGLFLGGTKLQPMYNGSLVDNTLDLGHPDRRFDDLYATNGAINTSDFNEKQDIASLTATEMLVGKRISALFKTFRWKDKVVEKGDNARTHTGVIAQDVQAAFTAEGLDAGDYALFISSTWFVDAEGNEVEEGTEGATSKTRLGIRYPELLSFVAAYNEQRFASIEARLTALEA